MCVKCGDIMMAYNAFRTYGQPYSAARNFTVKCLQQTPSVEIEGFSDFPPIVGYFEYGLAFNIEVI